MSLLSQIESLLFITNKPITHKRLSQLTGADDEKIKETLDSIQHKFNTQESGIHIARQGTSVQFITAPSSGEVIEEFLKAELVGEMTKPQLETLTIIAYRGPVIKEELETIRGVNCSLILRNLMIRGLIEMVPGTKDGQDKYQITLDFMNFLGITDVKELPNYETLSQHENINTILETSSEKNTNSQQKNPKEPSQNAGVSQH